MDVTMTTVICCNCYVAFAIPTELDIALRRCHNEFYCPKGHGQHYTSKSDIQIANEARDTAIRLKLQAQAELEALKKKKCKPKKR